MADTVTIAGLDRTITLDDDWQAINLVTGEVANRAPSMDRTLVTAGDPDARYPAPPISHFFDDHGRPVEFIAAPALEAIADALMEARAPLFDGVRGFKFAYLWKIRGGGEGGKARLGQCQRTSGLTRYFGTVDFVLWLAADHCRDGALSRWQAEALVCHELLHAAVSDTGAAAIAPHDFSGFNLELSWYGGWQRDLQQMVRQARQLPMFDDGAA